MKKRHTQLLLRDERGFTLFSAFLLLVLLLTLGTASLVYSTLELRSSTHYETGNQALYAAEAGLIHALGTMNSTGVVDFQNDVASRWATVFGSDVKSTPADSDVQYQVTVAANPADPTNLGTLTATGTAPLQARRIIRVALRKGGFAGGPGALYLAADDVSSTFNGSSFLVDGNDYGINGLQTGNKIVPGIATRNDGVTDEVVDSLNNNQKQQVLGQGFSMNPLTPSVLTTGGPSVDDLDRIISEVLSTSGVATTSTNRFNGNDSFGSIAAPQITHMTAGDVRLNGNAMGAGILIVDGSLTINGTLDFWGWIIVRGDTVINAQQTIYDDGTYTYASGNATILGSLWTGDLQVRVGGHARVNYCDTCLQLVDSITNPNNLVPRPMVVSSWQEVL
jgi:PilX N-terminal